MRMCQDTGAELGDPAETSCQPHPLVLHKDVLRTEKDAHRCSLRPRPGVRQRTPSCGHWAFEIWGRRLILRRLEGHGITSLSPSRTPLVSLVWGGGTLRCGPLFTADLCDGFTSSTLSSRALTLCLSSPGYQTVTDGVSGNLRWRSCSFLPGGAFSWLRNILALSTGRLVA